MNILGTQIRRKRKELKLTVEELANRAGVSPSALSAIERGESQPTLETITGIVMILCGIMSEYRRGYTGEIRITYPAANVVTSEQGKARQDALDRIMYPQYHHESYGKTIEIPNDELKRILAADLPPKKVSFWHRLIGWLK